MDFGIPYAVNITYKLFTLKSPEKKEFKNCNVIIITVGRVTKGFQGTLEQKAEFYLFPFYHTE